MKVYIIKVGKKTYGRLLCHDEERALKDARNNWGNKKFIIEEYKKGKEKGS